MSKPTFIKDYLSRRINTDEIVVKHKIDIDWLGAFLFVYFVMWSYKELFK